MDNEKGEDPKHRVIIQGLSIDKEWWLFYRRVDKYGVQVSRRITKLKGPDDFVAVGDNKRVDMAYIPKGENRIVNLSLESGSGVHISVVTAPDKETEIWVRDLSARMKSPSPEEASRLRELEKLAMDPSRSGVERIKTILEIGTFQSWSSTVFLLKNIELIIPVDPSAEDDDKKQKPCLYALKKNGEATYPSVLHYLGNGKRDETYIKEIAALFRSVSGVERSKTFMSDTPI